MGKINSINESKRMKVEEFNSYVSSEGGFWVDMIVLLPNGKRKRIIGYIKRHGRGYRQIVVCEYYL